MTPTRRTLPPITKNARLIRMLIGLSPLTALSASVFMPAVGAQGEAGKWEPGPSLDSCRPASPSCTGRQGHTATLLKNGKVLLAGSGPGQAGAGNSAQLYDPAKNTWAATGSSKSPLHSPTATLLRDGKVLLAGAQGAELYDPQTGNWSEVPPPPSSHGEHTATLLPDGKVLIAGGLGSEVGTTAAVVYDPTTNSWAPTRPLNQLRYQHSAQGLKDGKVLVVGGFSQDYGPKRATAELYDPKSQRWGPAASLKAPYSPTQAAATLLNDGKVLLTGGQSTGQGQGGGGGDRMAQLYNPATNDWTEAAAMNAGRSMHTATRLSNGKVLVVGGTRTTQIPNRPGLELPPGISPDDLGPPPSATAELYDPAANTWTAVPASRPRSGHTATLLEGARSVCGANCGKVLITGGRTLARANLPGDTAVHTELFQPAGGRDALDEGEEQGAGEGTDASPAREESGGLSPYLMGGVAAVVLAGLATILLTRRGRRGSSGSRG